MLGKRRGHVTADVAKPGTPIFLVKAFLPVLESFGFETDLRYHTQGQAFCLSVFDHWQVRPRPGQQKPLTSCVRAPAPARDLVRRVALSSHAHSCIARLSPLQT